MDIAAGADYRWNQGRSLHRLLGRPRPTPHPTGVHQLTGVIPRFALNDEGELTCWASTDDGRADAPDGRFGQWTPVGHTRAQSSSILRGCWGFNVVDQSVLQSGHFSEIDVATRHSACCILIAPSRARATTAVVVSLTLPPASTSQSPRVPITRVRSELIAPSPAGDGPPYRSIWLKDSTPLSQQAGITCVRSHMTRPSSAGETTR